MLKLLSVDDRLLHGQVAFYWTQHYSLDSIIVLNDEAANDEFTKMILGLAKPREVQLQILEVMEGLNCMEEYFNSQQHVMVIVGNLFDANRILEHFKNISTFNIGGLRIRPNAKILNDRIALTAEDIGICRRLLERKIRITVRHSPEIAEIQLSEAKLCKL